MDWGGSVDSDWNDFPCDSLHPYICQEREEAPEPEPEPDPEIGADCDEEDDGFYDCDLECYDGWYIDEDRGDWLGDEDCDDGEGGGWGGGGPNLDCIEFDFDGGDCEPPLDAFLPSGEYDGDLESVLIVEYPYGGLESRYSCEGDVIAEIDTSLSPQIWGSSSCVSEYDGTEYTIDIEGDFTDEVPSGTITFSGDDVISTDWIGTWAFGNLEATFEGTLESSSSGWTTSTTRYEGEFELYRID